MAKNIFDIDTESKRAENTIDAVVKLLNFKSNVDKNIVRSLTEVKKSRSEAVTLLNDMEFGIEAFINESIEDSKKESKLTERQAESLRKIYLNKSRNNTDVIITDLLKSYEHGLKMSVLVNKAKNKIVFQPNSEYTFDGAGRKIRIAEKHRRNTRKLALDLTNDIEAYFAYYNGKNTLYGIKNGIKTYFSVDDYLKSGLKDKMFHPNSQTLLQIEG